MRVFRSTFLWTLGLSLFMIAATFESYTHTFYQIFPLITYPVKWEAFIQNLMMGITASTILIAVSSWIGYCSEKKVCISKIWNNSRHLYVLFCDLIGEHDLCSKLSLNKRDILAQDKNLYHDIRTWMDFYAMNWVTDNTQYKPICPQSRKAKDIRLLQEDIALTSLGLEDLKKLYIDNRNGCFDGDVSLDRVSNLVQKGPAGTQKKLDAVKQMLNQEKVEEKIGCQN